MQTLSEVVAYEQVTSEFSVPIQAAGLRVGLIDICKDNAPTPDALRRSLVRQLQATLPKSVPLSVRADASTMPNVEFAKTEAKVREAVIAAAHASPVLRPVIERDRSGRDITTWYGSKRSWMRQFAKEPQLMESINGQPVRIPTILNSR